MDLFKIIKTEDGSVTIFLNEYLEAMHSVSGAYDEALRKHVYPSKILEMRNDCINILDIGFGLGYNVLACMIELFKINYQGEAHIYSLEKERSCLQFMRSVQFNDEKDKLYQKLINGIRNEKFNIRNIYFEINYGDARVSFEKIKNKKYDAVFHDPFSPSKNPELWSVEYFKKIYSVMATHGILTTYSSADHIRMAMVEAGFYIAKGPSVGNKREGTIATRIRTPLSMSDDEIRKIRKKIKSTPYHDPDLIDSRESILKKRIDEMKMKRENQK